MITLDPEMIGSLAPPSKLTTAVDMTLDGKPRGDISFAQLPRYERLRVQGKADDAEATSANGEDDDGDEEGGDGEGNKAMSRAEKEKKKMRGKGKSLKRYLRKQRKNVIDPRAVRLRFISHLCIKEKELMGWLCTRLPYVQS
jgi:U3 small nucleolar RNA-associated protein 7